MTPISSRFLASLHRVSAALYPANPPPTTRTRFGKSLYGPLSHGSYLGPVRNARRTTSAAAAPPPTASAPLSNPFIAPSAPARRFLRSGGAGPVSLRNVHAANRLVGSGGPRVQAPLQQEVHAVEDDPDQQRDPRQPQDGDVVYGLVDQERRGNHGTEDGEHRRSAEVLVPDLVAAQHEDGDVDHHERYEEQDDGGAAQSAQGLVVAADRDEQQEGYGRGEEDGDPRGAAAPVHAGEHGGHYTLVAHAVDDAGGHDHVDQGAVGDGQERDGREELGRDGERPGLHNLEQGPARLGERPGGHHHRGCEGDEQVDHAGEQQRPEDGARVVPTRVLGLLSDVDRVVEADEGVERQDRAAQEGGQDARALLELECPSWVARPGGERHDPDKNDEDEARDLDARQDHVDSDRLGDPVEVDGPDQDHEDERGAYDRHAYELRQVVATEREGEGARRGDTGRHHRERHHEADERVPEGVVDVGGGPARPRVLGNELGVGGGREDREHERAEKGSPDGAPYYAPDLANQRVDPRPDYVSQNEEQQQPRPYASLKVGVFPSVRYGLVHPPPPPWSPALLLVPHAPCNSILVTAQRAGQGRCWSTNISSGLGPWESSSLRSTAPTSTLLYIVDSSVTASNSGSTSVGTSKMN